MMARTGKLMCVTAFLVILTSQATGAVWPPTVLDYQKISSTQGGFTGILDNDDHFGDSAVSLGDLDGDGVSDLAVGAGLDQDGGDNSGAIWILFLNADGTVKAHQKISDLYGGFTGNLDVNDYFGTRMTALGDLDGDGVLDIAVGAPGDDDGSPDTGAIWILFLNTDGTVKAHQKISNTQGGLGGALQSGAGFGTGTGTLGDLDGDGVTDIAVGARYDNDGGSLRGAVWILFLNSNGTVKSYQKISDTQGGFTGILNNGAYFGTSVTSLGDLDGDGISDIAVGADRDVAGAVWILFLNADGTVKTHQKINDTEGGFNGALDVSDFFGSYVDCLGDLDGDGNGDIAVSAILDDDGGGARGAVWLLLLNSDGTVKDHQKISDTQGGFTGRLDNSDLFGFSVTSLGDLDGDGLLDIAVGARRDDDGGTDRGAVWILGLNIQAPSESYNYVAMDIKPGNCRNPLNLKKRGMLSVAILGTEEFDVSTIDPVSIRLEGIAPLRSAMQDVSNPIANGDDCQCSPARPDGYDDLTLKFSAQEIAESLANSYGQLTTNEILSLELTAELSDGTAITASDCVVLVGNISKWLAAMQSDINADGVIDILDFTELAAHWLQNDTD